MHDRTLSKYVSRCTLRQSRPHHRRFQGYISHLAVYKAPSEPEKEEALVTQCNLGIGKATAIRLAQDGASDVINYASDSAAANEIVEKIAGLVFSSVMR